MTDVTEALERHSLAVEAEHEQRARMIEDIRFASLDQWPDKLRNLRETDPNGSRPCLVLDKQGQYMRQIENDVRQNMPGIRFKPVGNGADQETAKVLNGLMRHTDETSPSNVAYLTAFISQVRTGLGWFRVQTEYLNDDSWDQDVRIARIPNVFSVYRDPFSTEVDGSDMGWLFITEDVKRKKDKNISEWSGGGPGDLSASWFGKDTMRIAEYFSIHLKKDDILLLEDQTVMYGSRWKEISAKGEELAPVIRTRPVKKRVCTWQKITGSEVLEETEFPSSFIPVIPVEGSEFVIDGKRVLHGALRAARDPQRGFNYWGSVLTEVGALMPRAPYIGATGQFKGHEKQWDNANWQNFARLEYEPLTIAGTLVGAPQRQPFPGVPAGIIQLLQMFETTIQSAFGMYQASVGAVGRERSGVALAEQKREGDIGQSHFRYNLGLSMRHCAHICLEIWQRIIDTDRLVRIIGEDGKQDMAMISPGMRAATMETPEGVPNIHNITIGRYDVAIDIGPAYATRRDEAAQGMLDIVRAIPAMMQTHGDLLFANLPWPGAEEMAERSQKMLPPEITAGQDGGPPQIPPQIMAQFQQAMQQNQAQLAGAQQIIEELQQQLQKAVQEAEERRLLAMDKGADLRIKERDLQVKAFEAETRRIETEVKAQEIEARMRQINVQTDASETQAKTVSQVLADLMQAQQAIVVTMGTISNLVTSMQGEKRVELVRDAQGRASGAIVSIISE